MARPAIRLPNVPGISLEDGRHSPLLQAGHAMSLAHKCKRRAGAVNMLKLWLSKKQKLSIRQLVVVSLHKNYR